MDISSGNGNKLRKTTARGAGQRTAGAGYHHALTVSQRIDWSVYHPASWRCGAWATGGTDCQHVGHRGKHSGVERADTKHGLYTVIVLDLQWLERRAATPTYPASAPRGGVNKWWINWWVRRGASWCIRRLSGFRWASQRR